MRTREGIQPWIATSIVQTKEPCSESMKWSSVEVLVQLWLKDSWIPDHDQLRFCFSCSVPRILHHCLPKRLCKNENMHYVASTKSSTIRGWSGFALSFSAKVIKRVVLPLETRIRCCNVGVQEFKRNVQARIFTRHRRHCRLLEVSLQKGVHSSLIFMQQRAWGLWYKAWQT